ncbi:hypothetical protein [Rhizobium sp. NXC24]|uniref:hypothetical protein n=1 Tax=Rhizobium sp. NXC24 TaxID=2048897 RepID=UPI000CDF3EDF|nr:hypothetical protein [Rhizobium sp. NXC24]AVA20661.1 hypothetical protein NXC24_CH00994 [Rhizobium sp. NXC24]
MNRSPNGINIHRFLEGYGVRVLPYHLKRDPRPANVIYGGRQVARLLRKDVTRTGLVIRCIQASNPTCFDDASIWSTWCFLAAHSPHSAPSDAIKAFSAVDLADIKKRAQRLAIGPNARIAKTTTAFTLLIAQTILRKDEAA